MWAVRGQPTHPTLVLLCGTKFHIHFRSPTHQNTIYGINHNPNSPNSPHTIRGLSNMAPKIPIIRSQVLGPIKRPLTASIILNHRKTLKQKVKPSRIKPLPHEVCRNSLKPEPMRCPRRVERLSFLLRRNPTVGLAGILERSHSLSL